MTLDTVLVIERGNFSNGHRGIVPYWSNSLDLTVMMRPLSAPVAKLNNTRVFVPIAAVVGGGTVVNGMTYMRGTQVDYDSWEELGNPGWGWQGLLPYFRKSTTFLPPSSDTANRNGMTWNLSVYDHGPLHITIPDFQYQDTSLFYNACKTIDDVPRRIDIGEGLGPGLYWTQASIDRRDQTRATSRKAYYDTVYLERPNLRLLIGNTVTEILFRNLTAIGVRTIPTGGGLMTTKFFARKEVILAAGAFQTPQLLQVSGIGPKKVLQAAGISLKKDMPAVGANFQDHPTIRMAYTLSNQSFPNPDTIAKNTTYNDTVWQEYWQYRTGPVAAGGSSVLVSVSLTQLLASSAAFVNKLLTQKASDYLPEIYEFVPLLKGFEAQRKILAKTYISLQATVANLPYLGNGFAVASFQKPLSRGTVTLNLTDPQALPVVQYNTLTNPLEADILTAMVRRARRFWSSAALSALAPVEATPGSQYQTDEEIMFALTQQGVLAPGLAHGCGTCAMMPEALGGCVGSDLRVYGLERLSIVDASIIPLIPAATLQATVYAIAEKAADLIKARG